MELLTVSQYKNTAGKTKSLKLPLIYQLELFLTFKPSQATDNYYDIVLGSPSFGPLVLAQPFNSE